MSDEFAPLRGPEQCVGKHAYVNKSEALAALASILARQRRRKNKRRIARLFSLSQYRCPRCSKWHLG